MTQLKLAAAGIVLIAMLALATVALWYRSEAISAEATAAKAKADLATAVAANKQAAETIDALQEQARLDNRLAASVLEQMQAIRDGLADQNTKLDNLEQADAPSHDYLSTPVPAATCGLYHRC